MFNTILGSINNVQNAHGCIAEIKIKAEYVVQKL